jgi:hypothetical protein
MTLRTTPQQGIRPLFRFRAHRRYIHSTDLYTVLLGIVESAFPGAALTQLEFSFHRTAESQLAVHIGPFKNVGTGSRPPIDFAVSVDGEEVRGWLEELDEAVVHIEPYDESPIRALCTLGKNSVKMTEQCDAAPIEILTSLTTHLHETAFPAPKGMKWYLGRLELDHPLTADDVTDICIRNVRLLGDRQSRCEISCHGKRTGQIIFSTAATS